MYQVLAQISGVFSGDDLYTLLAGSFLLLLIAWKLSVWAYKKARTHQNGGSYNAAPSTNTRPNTSVTPNAATTQARRSAIETVTNSGGNRASIDSCLYTLFGARQDQNQGFETYNFGSSEGTAEETGPMVYYASNSFGLKDKEYIFKYKKVGSGWRAYILRTPPFGTRDTSGIITHRLFDGQKSYVCWDTEVADLKGIQAVSKLWANLIQEYIATGKRFG